MAINRAFPALLVLAWATACSMQMGVIPRDTPAPETTESAPAPQPAPEEREPAPDAPPPSDSGDAAQPKEPEATPNTTKPAPGAEDPKPKTCDDGKHVVGDKWKKDCNDCVCQKDGKVACTLKACLDG